jgi:hypothetical protein
MRAVVQCIGSSASLVAKFGLLNVHGSMGPGVDDLKFCSTYTSRTVDFCIHGILLTERWFMYCSVYRIAW